MLESTDSHAISTAMHIFGEQVDAANRRARSEGGARSIVSGVASVVGSALGLRSRSPPPEHAAAHEQHANVTFVRPRVEPPVAEPHASDIHDAEFHRSVTEVGANGPVPVGAHAPENYTIHTPPTPPTTLPYGESPMQLNLRSGNGPIIAEAVPVPTGDSAEAFHLPIGNRSMHGSRASGISELRRRELEQEAAEDAAFLAAEEAAAAQIRIAALMQKPRPEPLVEPPSLHVPQATLALDLTLEVPRASQPPSSCTPNKARMATRQRQPHAMVRRLPPLYNLHT